MAEGDWDPFSGAAAMAWCAQPCTEQPRPHTLRPILHGLPWHTHKGAQAQARGRGGASTPRGYSLGE